MMNGSDSDDEVNSESSFPHGPPTTWKDTDVLHHMEDHSDEEEEHGAGDTVSTMNSTTADHVPHVSRPAALAARKRMSSRHKNHSIYRHPSKVSKQAETTILRKLKGIYKYRILPIEKQYSLNSFCLPTKHSLRDEEFEANPMVLLLGPYSTGKTTFIRHTLGCDFPGIHIGPEPTSDKFMALVHGGRDGVSFDENLEGDDDDGGKIIKGNTLTVTPDLPFGSLSSFGSAFLNHFNGSVSSSPLLRDVTIIDTPGVLSGEKQRLSRDYDFAQATKWFADRSDLILLLFDAHKLDFSDELKEVVETIRPHNDDKIRVILNKCDSIERNQLVRVYGSLLWSLGKLLNTAEVTRIYTGSYWNEPLVHDDFKSMFEHDEKLLMEELVNLSQNSAERKVNAMVKRIRLVKVHMCILGHLGQKMPRWYSTARARERLMNDLDKVFDEVCSKYNLSKGDMPKVHEFRDCLEAFSDFSIFPVPETASLRKLDDLIDRYIPAMMKESGILGKGPKGAGMKGSTKSGLRFILGGFGGPTDDHDFILDEEEGDKKRKSSLGKILWMLLFLAALAGGLYYALLSADLVAPISEWSWPDMPKKMLPGLKIPEFHLPELSIPEFRMSSVIYLGGALLFLMLHFFLRTSRV